MTNFYLYLDESGQFDENGKATASIVAGFLTKINCTEATAQSLLIKTQNSSEDFSEIDIKNFHAMKKIGSTLYEFITALLENMAQKDFQLVVFKSDKSYVTVNSDVTYLNVFAEGIVNLLQRLLAQTDDEIFLKVLYASRLNVAEKNLNGRYISLNEESYLERIEERIDWRLLRLKSSDRRRIKKSFHADKAEQNATLMLADAVCFALRGGKKKFTSAQKSRIRNLPCMSFSLSEKFSWREVQNLLIENRIGEAIYSWYVYGKADLFAEYSSVFQESAVKKLRLAGETNRQYHYDTISQFIGNLVGLADFDTVKKIVADLDKEFFPLLAAKNLDAPIFLFDVHFHRLTVATHEGNTLDEQHEIKICREILPTLPATCERLDYFLKYKLREVEHLKNIYDFDCAIKELDRLEKILSNMIELLKMIDDLEPFSTDLRSTTLGKVLGSRATSKIYAAYQNRAFLNSARKDLTVAIAQFTSDADKARQFQSWAHLETLLGNFNEALSWLGKAFKSADNSSPAKVLNAIKNSQGIKNFGLSHFANLMAASLSAGRSLGKEMFAAWKNQNAEELLQGNVYPVPIILWRVGKCRALLMDKSAKKYYDKAIEYLLENQSNYTLLAEALIVEADRLATINDNEDSRFLRKIRADYKNFSALPLPPSIRKAFTAWEKLNDAQKSPVQLKIFCSELVKRTPVI